MPAITAALKPDLNNGLVKEALQRLQKLFESPDAAGPADIANFLEAQEDEERAVIMRDAFETLKSLFEAIAELQRGL